ncbi:MAG: hypothetical protein ABSB78_07170 [Bacteroidota bacterium]
MDWLIVIISLVIAGGTIWGIQMLFKRRYDKIGKVVCWWYTLPALSGIGIMCSYIIIGFYLYFTTFNPNYIFFFWLGLVLLGFYFFFGRAAIGSFGIFWNGRMIPWKAIYDYQFTERLGNRLRWQFRWRESPAAAGNRYTIIIIPASHRVKTEEIIRNTLQSQSDDLKEETH